MDYRPPDLPRHVRGLRKLAVDQAEHIAALQAQLAEVSEEKRTLRKRLNKALETPKAAKPEPEAAPFLAVVPVTAEERVEAVRAALETAGRVVPSVPPSPFAAMAARIHAAGVAS